MIVTVAELQARLPELLEQLPSGEEITVIHDHRPVAKLVVIAAKKSQAEFGNCRGKMTIVSDDDDHLMDFADYM
jgi:antitoxin (DNA-binding transcriptional repressor) of toxin-antitoxin stability system